MTLIQTVLLYGCTAVCALYLIAGGYKTIRAYIQKKNRPGGRVKK